MKTAEIQTLFCEYLVKAGHEFVCENLTHHDVEWDIVALTKSLVVYEYEVKASRPDFLVDQKKGKWAKYKGDVYFGGVTPNFLYYVCPEGLVQPDELPVFAGLYTVNQDGKITLKKKATKIVKKPAATVELIMKMLRHHTERKYLGGCRLTVHNRAIREKNKARGL